MNTSTTITEAQIEADATVPVVRITRDFQATPAQVLRAHTDPELFVRWVGPDSISSEIDYWDARTGGSWRYVSKRKGDETARNSPSAARSTRSPTTRSCRPSPGRACPTASRWRR